MAHSGMTKWFIWNDNTPEVKAVTIKLKTDPPTDLLKYTEKSKSILTFTAMSLRKCEQVKLRLAPVIDGRRLRVRHWEKNPSAL